MDRLLEYAQHHPYLAAGALLAAVIVLIYELRERQTNFAAIAPQQLVRLSNQGALLLDVRPQDSFAAGHINGARRIDSHEILTAGDSLKKYKEKPVVVYCDTGSLGASAARQLAAQGFKQAVNLRGGLTTWRTENLPLVKDGPAKISKA